MAEKEYIEREALIKKLGKIEQFHKLQPCDLRDKIIVETIRHCCGEIKILPAADVVEVRHGEWVYNENGMDWGLGAWECSLCRCKNDNLPPESNIKPLRWAGSKYCPHCGAKMDGERKEK